MDNWRHGILVRDREPAGPVRKAACIQLLDRCASPPTRPPVTVIFTSPKTVPLVAFCKVVESDPSELGACASKWSKQPCVVMPVIVPGI